MRRWLAALFVVIALPAVIYGGSIVVSLLPPFDPVADVGKVPTVQSNGTIVWGSASGISGGVAGSGTSTNGDLVAYSGTGGTRITDSGILGANVVQTSRAVLAGTGLTVTNGGLLSADITMSIALGASGQMLIMSPTGNNNTAWSYDHTGFPGATAATAGYVGETLTSSRVLSGATGATSGVAKNVIDNTGLVLTAGDWDIRAAFGFNFATTTSYTFLIGAVATTSGTNPGTDVIAVPTNCEARVDYDSAANVPGNNANIVINIPAYRCSVAAGATTTIFAVGTCGFSISTCKMFAWMQARRVR